MLLSMMGDGDGGSDGGSDGDGDGDGDGDCCSIDSWSSVVTEVAILQG